MKTIFHMSGGSEHIRVERCEEYGFERMVVTPVLSHWGGIWKKFGTPKIVFRLDGDEQIYDLHSFRLRLAARHDPEGLKQYYKARRSAQRTKRGWRRNRNRIKLKHYVFRES